MKPAPPPPPFLAAPLPPPPQTQPPPFLAAPPPNPTPPSSWQPPFPPPPPPPPPTQPPPPALKVVREWEGVGVWPVATAPPCCTAAGIHLPGWESRMQLLPMASSPNGLTALPCTLVGRVGGRGCSLPPAKKILRRGQSANTLSEDISATRSP